MEQNSANYVTVEIYDQTYHLSGEDAEHIRKLAAQVDAKMRAVAAQGRQSSAGQRIAGIEAEASLREAMQ